jgi:hypothetical protein
MARRSTDGEKCTQGLKSVRENRLMEHERRPF